MKSTCRHLALLLLLVYAQNLGVYILTLAAHQAGHWISEHRQLIAEHYEAHQHYHHHHQHPQETAGTFHNSLHHLLNAEEHTAQQEAFVLCMLHFHFPISNGDNGHIAGIISLLNEIPAPIYQEPDNRPNTPPPAG